MKRAGLLGIGVLILAWGGPLPGKVAESFAAHMVLHMAVVGIAVPLIALGLRAGLGRRAPGPGPTTPGVATAQGPDFAAPAARWAVAVSLLDLVVVWGWHAPLPHMAARSSGWWLGLEQLSFFGISLAVWWLALGGRGGASDLAGAMALFFTSMHMTLLGGLLTLAPRDLYHGLAHGGAHSVVDQQVGGALMLIIGGVIYLGGALWLMSHLLQDRRPL